MSRPAALEPRWLVGLLNAWAKRSLSEQTRGLGWHSICPMLQSGIPGRARSYEPTGYCDDDFRRANDAVNGLPTVERIAVSWYFKPWAKAAIERELGIAPKAMMEILKTAMGKLESQLCVGNEA